MKIELALQDYLDVVKVVQNDNIAAVQESQIIILGCKPYMVKDILRISGLSEALDGKLIISICAGLTVPQIHDYIYGSSALSNWGARERCRVIRAIPNTASSIRESMTVVATPSSPLSEETSVLLTWIFKRIGEVVYLLESNMDTSSALCGSGPAFFALVLEAAIDGAVAMGLPRAEAQKMAAQTMKGAAGLILSGEHPAILIEMITTSGGCTAGGLVVLVEGSVRGTVARAIRETTCIASQLGKEVQDVNGTRF